MTLYALATLVEGESQLGDGDPVDDLAKLTDLRASGALTEAEFEAQKARVLGRDSDHSSQGASHSSDDGRRYDANQESRPAADAQSQWGYLQSDDYLRRSKAHHRRFNLGLNLILIAVGVLLVPTVIGLIWGWFAGGTGGNSKQAVTYTFTYYGGNCAAARGYGMENGTAVTVTGDKGARIGTGALNNAREGTSRLKDGSTIDTCTFTSAISVPGNQTRYTFKTADANGVTFSSSELESTGWTASVTNVDCPSDLRPGC
jgi:hypothetical protein